MENVIYQDTPLADYLEGEGENDTGHAALDLKPSSIEQAPAPSSFAPHGLPNIKSRLADKILKPRRVAVSEQNVLKRIHAAWSHTINSKLGKADNARFLEHFRYIIVASQLLDEHPGHGSFKPRPTHDLNLDGAFGQSQYADATTNSTGALLITLLAFGLAWLLHWSIAAGENGRHGGRVCLALATLVFVATAIYVYARRQWLKRIRQQALDMASALVVNLDAFEASTSSAISLIQEVELVSRGYRITPLPPITRLEERDHTRRCLKLRRSLRTAFSTALPVLADVCGNIRNLVEDNDDLEKYFDIYDINDRDLVEINLGFTEDEFEDPEALKALRTFSYRFSTLRRVALCSLLAIPADGSRLDFSRWRSAIEMMEHLASVIGSSSERLNEILTGEELSTITPNPSRPATPRRERLRGHVRKLGSLSQGIRGLQAKMQILREETVKTLEESEDTSDPVPSLVAEYESIGTDLKSLMQAWEAGKASLAVNIERHERRISQSSNGLRSPAPSLGGATAVDGSPTDALRALNGEPPLRSPTSSVSASASDEEIFEAIAIPRRRSLLNREERMARVQEERIRQTSQRERREANTNMLKELESVIRLRPSKSVTGRVLSL